VLFRSCVKHIGDHVVPIQIAHTFLFYRAFPHFLLSHQIPRTGCQKSRCDDSIRKPGLYGIPRQLFRHKFCIGFIRIECADYIIAIRPCIIPPLIFIVAMSLTIMNDIQPMARPSLAIPWRIKEAIDQITICDITNVVNWRPRENRKPNDDEIALCRPFIERHIALKKPKILVVAGGIAAQSLLGATQGITRLRGKWASYTVKNADGSETEIPVLPIYHPAYVLRRAIGKRDVWRDLLGLEERLKSL